MDFSICQTSNFGWYACSSRETIYEGNELLTQGAATSIRIIGYIPIIGSMIACIALKTFREQTKGASLMAKGVYCFRWGIGLLSVGFMWLPFDLLATLVRVVASAIFSHGS